MRPAPEGSAAAALSRRRRAPLCLWGRDASRCRYPFHKAQEVRALYDTCIPECATDEDTYHAAKDLCAVTDSVLIQWLNGDGQKCARGTVGERAIKSATAALDSPQGYWYAPDAADKVRARGLGVRAARGAVACALRGGPGAAWPPFDRACALSAFCATLVGASRSSFYKKPFLICPYNGSLKRPFFFCPYNGSLLRRGPARLTRNPRQVRSLLETCHSQCAKGDILLHDQVGRGSSLGAIGPKSASALTARWRGPRRAQGTEPLEGGSRAGRLGQGRRGAARRSC